MAKRVAEAPMTVRAREMLRAQPFAPFSIKTADGDTFTVHHPEFVMISPTGLTAAHFDRDDHFRFINLHHVVSVEPVRPKKGMLGQGGGKK